MCTDTPDECSALILRVDDLMLQIAGPSGMLLVICVFKLFSVSHTHSAGNQLVSLTAYSLLCINITGATVTPCLSCD